MIDLKNIGQKQADLLRDAYLNKKVAHSYLFVDPNESGASRDFGSEPVDGEPT